jgi:hypothetical protein
MYKSKYKRASSKIVKRNKTRRIFGLVLKIGLLIAFFIGLIFLLRAGFLQIKSFEILGTETIPPEDIKDTASNFASGTKFFLIPKSNILFLSKEKLATTLLLAFPRIEKINTNKQFFSGSIELTIAERKADFLWCLSLSDCFFMDKTGFIFEKSNLTKPVFLASSLKESEPLNRMIFTGILEDHPLMKNFASPEKMQNYLNFAEVLKNNGFEVISINIESSDRAIAKSNIGDVIFNPEEIDLSSVAQNVVLLINEIKGKNPFARFQYIDARFGNKVFYKLY